MANNYYDGTGVLLLDTVTPVITALFDGYKLDPTYPGNGAAYVALIAEDNSPQWIDVRDGLEIVAKQHQLSLGDGEERSLTDLIELLATHFQTTQSSVLHDLLSNEELDNEPNLYSLFVIAQVLDDGHGLRAIEWQGCWHSSKPRLSEFGGDFFYNSRSLRLSGNSSTWLELARTLEAALLADELDDAARLITQSVGRVFAGVNDTAIRVELHERVCAMLHNSQH
ncbi:hypothetical protein C4K14_3989 [Pseudomonas chlororaphis subsp. aureofaciens]|uniref:hypothetical protein n=1 Tax=Pseudomonas chlororaphis TaxID=587753 RepID=UPI000F56CA77|nr:hypothetical protein [Pseudomonas chlororaphis]AZD86811.1 hypothetical protein C4K14_3989 [Pseudomonas chlororaphis subsp. aureofaciens]